MWSKLFWKDVGERTVSTVAQVLIAVLTADGFNLLTADFTAIAVSCLVAGALVVLKSVAFNKAFENTPTISPASFAKDERGYQ